MHPDAPALVAEIAAFVEAEGLLDGVAPVLVAVSGGLDSIVLLDVMTKIAGDLPLVVAHVDHDIHEASREHARFVEELAGTYGRPCRVVRVTVPRDTSGTASERSAREARWTALRALARETGADRIATGHTVDDQAETLLLRLGRGTGPHGLAGMRPRQGSAGEIATVRPLLASHRDRLRDYAAASGLRWVEDPTNASDLYLRNRVRRELLPVLDELFGAGVRARIAALADLEAEARATLDWALEREGLGSERDDDGTLRLPLGPFRAAPVGLRRHALLRLCRAAGLDYGVYRSHVAALERLCAETAGSQRVDLPRGIVAERRYDTLLLRMGPRPTAFPEAVVALDGPGVYRWPGWELELRLVPPPHDAPGGEPDELWADAMGELFPLRLRAPAEGERVRLWGAEGRRKIGRVLIDRKVPAEERRAVRVLEDAAGQTLWIVGVARCTGRAVDPGSTRVLWGKLRRRPDTAGPA